MASHGKALANAYMKLYTKAPQAIGPPARGGRITRRAYRPTHIHGASLITVDAEAGENEDSDKAASHAAPAANGIVLATCAHHEGSSWLR